MEQQQMESCIEACNDCALANDRCAAACLKEQDVKAMASCISLNIDCAEICRLAVGVMARGSEATNTVCQACAAVCDMCADECDKHPQQYCRDCANTCRRCAAECRQMVNIATAGRTAGVGATPH